LKLTEIIFLDTQTFVIADLKHKISNLIINSPNKSQIKNERLKYIHNWTTTSLFFIFHNFICLVDLSKMFNSTCSNIKPINNERYVFEL